MRGLINNAKNHAKPIIICLKSKLMGQQKRNRCAFIFKSYRGNFLDGTCLITIPPGQQSIEIKLLLLMGMYMNNVRDFKIPN